MNFPNLSDKEFMEKFISVLDLGTKDSTYKFAFARFLLDYSREYNKSRVSFSKIAEYFLKYYWVQECRSKLNQTSQKFMKKSDGTYEKKFVMRVIIHNEFGEQYYPEEFDKIKEKEPQKIKNCIKEIESKCFNDVTYAFQNITGDYEDRPFFDYSVRYWKPRYDRNTKLPIIELKDGIKLNSKAMDFFKRHNVVLEKAVTLEWAKFIEQFNLGVPELIRKIEGKKEERKSTTKERKTLEEAGFKNCFYCKAPLSSGRKTQVEHVIPFSFIYQNEMWNFVLACQNCNCSKLGKLPPKEYIDYLIKRNENYRDKIPELEKSLSKLGERYKKIIQDHYENAKSHGYQIYTKFPKLDTNIC